jgi:hypothetical protein
MLSSSILRCYTLNATTAKYSHLNRYICNCSTINANKSSGGGVWGALKRSRTGSVAQSNCLERLGDLFRGVLFSSLGAEMVP